MRAMLVSACLTGLTLAASANGATLLTWDFGTSGGNAATSPATGVEPTMQSATLSRGAGMLAATSGFEPTRGSFTASDDNGSNPSTLALAITRNKYFQFVATPQPGMEMSLSGIDFMAWQQNSHAAATIDVQYSFDGFATAGTSAGSVTGIQDGWSGTLKSVDLSGISALQSSSSAVTFRLYYYGFGAWEQSGLGQVIGANTDVALSGETAAVPEPAGLGALALAAAALLRRRQAR